MMGIAIRYQFLTLLACFFAIIAGGQTLSVSPSFGYTGRWIPMRISSSGTRFKEHPQTVTVKFLLGTHIYPITSFTIVSDELITCKVYLPVSAQAGYYTVLVQDDVDGDVSTSVNPFAVFNFVTPQVNVIPQNVRVGIKDLPLYIEGKGTYFNYPEGALKVWLQKENTIINAIVQPGATQTEAYIHPEITSATPRGMYDLYLQDSFDSTIVDRNAVYLSNDDYPVITSVMPSTATRGSNASFTIKGTNCNFALGLPAFYLAMLKRGQDSIMPSAYDGFYTDQIKVEFHIPYTVKCGDYDLIVHDAEDGTLLSPFKVKILQNTGHKILSYSPHQDMPGARFSMSILGTNTMFTSGDNKVWLSQGKLIIKPLSLNVVDDENMYAYFVLPENILISSGLFDLNIHNASDGDTTISKAFSIFYPSSLVLLRAEPDTLRRGHDTILHVIGINTNFNKKGYFTLGTFPGKVARFPVNEVISPTEALIHITTDFGFDTGTIYLYYVDTTIMNTIHLRLNDLMYITDRPVTISTSKVEDQSGVLVYPSPFAHSFMLSYTLNGEEEVSIELCDLLGRKVFAQNIQKEMPGQYYKPIDIGAKKAGSGMYLLKLRRGNTETYTRIIKAEYGN